MSRWIFTFGFCQPLERCYTVVEAPTYEEARAVMVDEYKTNWAFQYCSEEEAGVERFGLRFVPFGTSNEQPDTTPDWDRQCENCGATPIVPATGLCGPCTFGDISTAGGNW